MALAVQAVLLLPSRGPLGWDRSNGVRVTPGQWHCTPWHVIGVGDEVIAS